MAVNWTEEQQRVIDARNENLLVSAAAGSGKTAVLVARILSLVTDLGHPVDIDRILVVTFTNAAASEMRERIRDALEERAEAEPGNAHLQRQLVLVHNARITTIHSFCLTVLRSHFHTLGIDPAFRVADEGERMLLEQEALKETMEAFYAQGGEPFHSFLEKFAPGKSDAPVEEMALSLYRFSLGQPWPGEWLESCREESEAPSAWGISGGEGQTGGGQAQGRAEPGWLSFAMEDARRILIDVQRELTEALAVAGEPDGPYPYANALEDDLAKVEALLREPTYGGLSAAFAAMGTYTRLGTKRDPAISEEKKARVQQMRAEAKDRLKRLREQYFYDSPEVLSQELARSGPAVGELTALTEDFSRRFAEKKREKNLLDFSDLEHMALQVLMERRDGKNCPTAAAREYAELFEEIMTDEYQDSNLVQELILDSISGRGRGEPNRFMVGDVKQSIYRFRLARPELFMEKYRDYQVRPDAERIDLHRNFRSRGEVLAGVNDLFRQIMTENLGGIAYDREAALYPGARFAPWPESVGEEGLLPGQGQPRGSAGRPGAFSREEAHQTELFLLEASGQERQEAEARLVAGRIRELVGRLPVWDKEEACYRPAAYRDVVVLLRTVSGWADTFSRVFSELGIPCFTGSQKGYFSAVEVRTVLSYLQVLDNPVQDIPLAASLRSTIGNFSDEELAVIRASSGKRRFYDCCQAYRKEGENPALREKLDGFFSMTESFRQKSVYMPIHLLLWEILDGTGYGEYAASLPGGDQRRANLDMLVEKAVAYEATSYRGLYHFVRYIENLKRYEVDYGEANTGGESEDTVRIMSIHKSKGLEFPIVFVSGLGKQFNESDQRARVLFHPEYGIGCDYVDEGLRLKRPTLKKKVIQRCLSYESLGEELRVLYVAMTRAKEKLILTGSVADRAAALAKWREAAGQAGETLPYSWLSSASTCLDWVMPALFTRPDGMRFLEEQGQPAAAGKGPGEEPPWAVGRKDPAGTEEALGKEGFQARFQLYAVSEEDLLEGGLHEAAGEGVRLQELLSLDPFAAPDPDTERYLEEVFSYVYPYRERQDIVGKLSVSELKKLSRQEEDTEARELYCQETVIPLIPAFRQEGGAVTGAARGSVYHTVMENFDFSKKEPLERQLEEWVSCGKMTPEEAKALRPGDIQRFLSSGTGRRMAAADARGCLHREAPFVLGVPAGEIRQGWSSQETVLIQGIIDAWFTEEDGEIVLVDYKTDRVRTMEELSERYRAQLEYYSRALARLTGRKVKERLLYSFRLGRECAL